MKIIVVGDPHFWDRDISSRCDNYQDTSINKLKQVVEYQKRYQVDCVIFLGDFFHAPLTSKEYLNELVLELKKFQCPLYTLVGNHRGDQSYKDWRSFEKKDLGTLVFTGVLNILLAYESSNGSIVGMSAYETLYDVLFEMNRYTETTKPIKNEAIHILACHHFIKGSGSSFEDDLILDVSEVKQTFPNLKYILAGHDHAKYDTKIIDGVKIIRPGSLMRTSSAGDQDRNICVAYLDTDMDIVEYLPISSLAYKSLFVNKDHKKDIQDKMMIDQIVSNFSNGDNLDTIMAEDLLKESVEQIDNLEIRDYIKSILRSMGVI